MIFKFSCGHSGTMGFWRDDSWVSIPDQCPQCKRRGTGKASKIVVIKGTHRLVLQPKQGGETNGLLPKKRR